MKRPVPRLTVGGIGEDISYLGKEIDRYQDEAGTAGSAFASAEAEV